MPAVAPRPSPASSAGRRGTIRGAHSQGPPRAATRPTARRGLRLRHPSHPPHPPHFPPPLDTRVRARQRRLPRTRIPRAACPGGGSGGVARPTDRAKAPRVAWPRDATAPRTYPKDAPAASGKLRLNSRRRERVPESERVPAVVPALAARPRVFVRSQLVDHGAQLGLARLLRRHHLRHRRGTRVDLKSARRHQLDHADRPSQSARRRPFARGPLPERVSAPRSPPLRPSPPRRQPLQGKSRAPLPQHNAPTARSPT